MADINYISKIQLPNDASVYYIKDASVRSDLSTNYYTKTNTYSKTEVNNLIDTINQFEVVVATSLPTASEETMRKLYLIPKTDSGETQNVKDEYITIKENNIYKWEKIGDIAISVSDTKVKQNVSTDNQELPILTKNSSATTTVTGEAKFASDVTVNPSEGVITANVVKSDVFRDKTSDNIILSSDIDNNIMVGTPINDVLSNGITISTDKAADTLLTISSQDENSNGSDITMNRDGILVINASNGVYYNGSGEGNEIATHDWVEDQGYLTSHQQLKTINNQSLVGSGNITIEATDTKNTAGSSQSASKLYLVGAQTQNANGVETFSNSDVYMENGAFGIGRNGRLYTDEDDALHIYNIEDIVIESEMDVNIPQIFSQGIYVINDDNSVNINQGTVTANVEVNAPTLKEGDIALSNKYEAKNRCLPLSGGTMTGNINMNAKDLIVYNKSKIGQVNGYIGLYSTSNELLIGNGSTDTTMYINYRQPGSGYIAPTTYALMAGSGSSYANVQANHFYSVSDERLKNVHGEIDLDKAYDLIDKCSTILYDLKDDEEHKVQVGVIAQEIQEFFPEIVNEDEKGTLSVDYSKLTVIIMRVLKDLINRIKKLEEK